MMSSCLNGSRPPSWIHLTPIWTICKEYLVVFIGVQNLVGFDAVVSKVLKFLAFSWKTPLHAPKIGVLGVLTPKWAALSTTSEKTHAPRETPHMTYRSLRLVHLFYTVYLFTDPPPEYHMLYNAFHWARHPKRVHSHEAVYIAI